MTSQAFKPKSMQGQISIDNFHSWTQNNFYRTSYGSHYRNLPELPKNVASPGYGGFIPYIKSSNLYGKSYSPLTRQAFSNANLGKDLFHQSTTGFNFQPKVHLDPAKNSISHLYGQQTIQKFHPCLSTEKWETQAQGTYKHPKSVVQPTFRETDKSLQTSKLATKQSGFEQNHRQFDGTGWVPEKVLDGDQVRTEYRIQYNQDKPFHREPNKFKLRRLKKSEANYIHT